MDTTTYWVDSKFDETLEELRKHYGVASKADVLRKAVAVLSIISRHENDDGNITLRRESSDFTIILR